MAVTLLPNGHVAVQNNEVLWLPITDTDAAGAVVPSPVGDVVSVVTTGTFAASLVAAVGVMPPAAPNAGAAAVSLTPTVIESDAGNSGGGIGITMTDSSGLPMRAATAGLLFDVVQNLTPTSEGLDTTNTFTTTQPVPTAPGP